jgi:hypothetical protein
MAEESPGTSSILEALCRLIDPIIRCDSSAFAPLSPLPPNRPLELITTGAFLEWSAKFGDVNCSKKGASSGERFLLAASTKFRLLCCSSCKVYVGTAVSPTWTTCSITLSPS